jgi:hypothetical protein
VTDILQIAAVSFSLLLLGLVVELVRRRRLTEEHSVIWTAGAAALLLLSLWRDVLHVAARVIGIHYPPALLLLALIGFVFLVSLYFSVVISRQRQEIERLIEEVALLDAHVRAVRASRGTVAPAEVVPDAARESRQAPDPGRLSRQQHVAGVQADDQPAA